MTAAARRRVAIVYRSRNVARDPADLSGTRLAPVASALEARGFFVVAVAYRDEVAEMARAALAAVDGILVWVDPISDGEDRSVLDELLRGAAERGVWVSAHPDVVRRMGTKDVLYRTRALGWSGDVHRYASPGELRARFPGRLASSGTRVLKQLRGNGGLGVWKVALVTDRPGGTVDVDTPVRVQHAHVRDATCEELTLGAVLDRCAVYFGADGSGALIDQAFQPRVTEGLIRCYFVRDVLVGFSRQYPAGRPPDDADVTPRPETTFGLPSPKTMFAADEPGLAALREKLEGDWVPGLARATGVGLAELPVLWDADFLLGEKTPSGDDTYVLCEVNVSSVTPFPDAAPAKIAGAVVDALGAPKSGPQGVAELPR